MRRLSDLSEVKREFNQLTNAIRLTDATTPIAVRNIEKMRHRKEALRNYYNRKKYWFMLGL